jgi:hypothetical protein
MARQKVNDALLKAVDFAFNSLGKSCKQALYFHLKTSFHIGRVEIPEKVEEFDNTIRLIFKDGAVFLEGLILEKLCDDLGVKFDRSHRSGFVETISRIRGIVSEGESPLMVSSFDEEVAVDKGKKGGERV